MISLHFFVLILILLALLALLALFTFLPLSMFTVMQFILIEEINLLLPDFLHVQVFKKLL